MRFLNIIIQTLSPTTLRTITQFILFSVIAFIGIFLVGEAVYVCFDIPRPWLATVTGRPLCIAMFFSGICLLFCNVWMVFDWMAKEKSKKRDELVTIVKKYIRLLDELAQKCDPKDYSFAEQISRLKIYRSKLTKCNLNAHGEAEFEIESESEYYRLLLPHLESSIKEAQSFAQRRKKRASSDKPKKLSDISD